MDVDAKHLLNLHSQVFQSLSDQIAVIDVSGKIVEVNDAWRRFGAVDELTDVDMHLRVNYLDVLTRSVAMGDETAPPILEGMRAVLDGQQGAYACEYPCDIAKVEHWFLMQVKPLEGSQRRHFVVSHHDITRRKRAEQHLQELASTDALTGLANRRRFEQFVEMEIRRCGRTALPMSLLLVDVDHFKQYNDSHGHQAGDQCLIELAQVFKSVARRPGDLAARLGGDEFALVLSDTAMAPALTIGKAILSGVRDLKLVANGGVYVTATLGLAASSSVSAHDRDAFYKAADSALYRAKVQGRDGIEAIQL